MAESASFLARVISGSIRAYQLVIRPALAPSCRFFPSCSEYARGAVLTHGALVGSRLAVARVARCHPWRDGGVDPVPKRKG